MKVGGNCLNNLKRGWNRKEWRGTKVLNRGGQAGSRGGCLEKGALDPPYELLINSKMLLKTCMRSRYIVEGNLRVG